MLSGSPGSVAEVVNVPLPYPRNQVETRRDPTYLELRAHLYNLMAKQVTVAREAVS
jgi:NitT/TauT family transport system ATP-binding protein